MSMEIAADFRLRSPRFRRVSEPLPFRLTDDDVDIIRQVARFRFIGSSHIAALTGRSLDRTNERLRFLFHAGYLDRPRAQMDRFPTGSTCMVYALADLGVRLLVQRDGLSFRNWEWSRKNRRVHRPFIEHQIEIANFRVALDRVIQKRPHLTLVPAEKAVLSTPKHDASKNEKFAFRARISHRGMVHPIVVFPDHVFCLRQGKGKQRNFVVEIDRGTMPVLRSDITQTSFAKKMRGYLDAYAAKQHKHQFGWDSFRVLTVTTDEHRLSSMVAAAQTLRVPGSIGPALFVFSTFEELRHADPLAHMWSCGDGSRARLI